MGPRDPGFRPEKQISELSITLPKFANKGIVGGKDVMWYSVLYRVQKLLEKLKYDA